MFAKSINFDMDGTIADFYGVENWLEFLENSDTYPYTAAKPLFNFSIFARILHKLQAAGWEINIISWTSKNGTEDFNEKVRIAKLRWLKKHLPSVNFDNISIVDYGTPKSSCGSGILFDDELRNREEWGVCSYDEHDILELLKELI